MRNILKQLVSLSLLLIVYGSDMCGYCAAQKQLLHDLDIQYSYIDVDKHPDIAVLCKIHVLPTLENTSNHTRHEGYMSKEELIKFLNTEESKI